MSEKSFSKVVSCGHCHNISPMVIIGNVNQENEYEDSEYGRMCDSGTIYSVLECPACSKINIVNYFWHDNMESEDEVDYEFLYPISDKYPLGLPDNILSTYKAAEKVKSIDVNAYAILMRGC